MKLLGPLLTATCALALLAPAAATASPPTVIANVTEGRATATAGPNGVFHVVWNDEGSHTITYCQLGLTGVGCTKKTVLSFNSDSSDPSGPVGAPETPWVVRDPGSGVLYIAMQKYNGTVADGNFAWLWQSNDNGATWSAPRPVHRSGIGTDPSRPILGPQPNTISFASTNPQRFIYDAPLDGSGAQVTNVSSLSSGSDPTIYYRTTLAPAGESTVATADTLSKVYAWSADAGITLGVEAAWGLPVLVAPGTDSTSGGANGNAFLGYVAGSPGHTRLDVRRWGGSAFSAAETVDDDPASPNLYVSPSGRPGIAYRKGDSLRFAFGNADGNFDEAKTIARSDEVFFDLNVATDDQGKGVAVWTRKGAIVASRLTEVADTTIPTESTTSTKDGITLGLNQTGSCVLPGKTTKLTVGGQGKGKVKKVVFKLGAQQKTDKSAPWSASFVVPKGAKPGASLTTKAIISVKTKKGTKTRTISSSLTVCGG